MMENNGTTDEMTTSPSTALNGARFVVACFVVQLHVGLFPSLGWMKVQSFSVKMIFFFLLGAFQLACTTRTSNLAWAQFVGTKIGAMHAWFMVAQIFALPSLLLFLCGSNGYLENFEEDATCSTELPFMIPAFVFKTLTGLLRLDETNPPAKVRDGAQLWHRMGDLGWLDDAGRIWFCGRKVEHVATEQGPLYLHLLPVPYTHAWDLSKAHMKVTWINLVNLMSRKAWERLTLLVPFCWSPFSSIPI